MLAFASLAVPPRATPCINRNWDSSRGLDCDCGGPRFFNGDDARVEELEKVDEDGLAGDDDDDEAGGASDDDELPTVRAPMPLLDGLLFLA